MHKILLRAEACLSFSLNFSGSTSYPLSEEVANRSALVGRIRSP